MRKITEINKPLRIMVMNGDELPSAGCILCDEDSPMADEFHHANGRVCDIVKRNFTLTDREVPPPLGRYEPFRGKL